ncbi:DUF1127 domain-containing protein [Shimia ponticola]|uniref:DUF1127 domain-containing protein n=1 Tax=Shimia ponticola TaxID=2582893 RepID=UPI002105EA00|nr:DUF1127 domain-containing protein [Shimia ponticola]
MQFLHSGIAKAILVRMQHIPIFDASADGPLTQTETNEMAYNSTLTASRFDVLARVQALFADAKDAWARYALYRTTLNELQALSNRELADLGLSRANLGSIAYETAYGK